VAELESEMKLMRFMRDMPKFERNSEYLQNLEQEVNPDFGDDEDAAVRRDRLEDLFGLSGSEAFQEAKNYEPVMYKLVSELDHKSKKDESLVDIQQGFLDRTERILRNHQQRSHIHDGLKELTNQEIINKLREGPRKLKGHAKGFLKVLRKYDITLDSDANPVFSHIEDENIRKFLERKESLVRVTLMQADLEFEYPQKLEKLLVKQDLLRWLDEEEEKLKNIALEEYMETES